MAERLKAVTPPFRVSFPSVFEASSYQGGDPKYSVVMLFYPDKFTEADKKAWKTMQAIADAASKDKFKKLIKDLPGNFKKPLRDGAEKAHLDGYGEGMMFGTASSKQRPGLVDRNKQPILTEEEFYPGCWARATITAYPYDNVGKGVAFGLHNLQKLGDDENFTGRVAAEDDFGDDADDVWQGADIAPGDDDPTA
jgi:hypothetical protein